MMNLKETATRLNERFMGADPQVAVTWFVLNYGRKAALSSSLSYEDQAVTAMMCRADKKLARVFTLDTGRQFPEFYNLLDRTQAALGISIEVFFPDYRKIQEMVIAAPVLSSPEGGTAETGSGRHRSMDYRPATQPVRHPDRHADGRI